MVRRVGGWTLLVALSLLSMGLAAGAGAAELIGSRRTATVQIDSFTCDGQRAGTGVIVDGAVVTNRHVVEGAYSVEVTLADGTLLASTSVSLNPSADIAVVDLERSPRGVEVATSAPAVGDELVIAGHPGSMDLTEQATTVDAVYETGLSGDPAVVVRGDTSVVAGHSGSPAFNDVGDVSAIVYASEHGSQHALMIGADEVTAAIAAAVPQETVVCG